MTVVLILIDGLRPDAISQTQTPSLQGLILRGAATFAAASVMPSITLPCHMSIFHSVPPARHGITTNTWSPMARPLPGLIERAKDVGLRCSFFYNWEPLRNLSQPGCLAFAYFRDNVYGVANGDAIIAAAAIQHIHEERPDFAFVYLGQVDVAGHAYGWMSPEYLAQVARADDTAGKIMAALNEQDVVLIQSDHGGHERTHGTNSPEDMQIPWIIAGPTIRQGHQIQRQMSLLDTAPTLAHLLGIPPYPEWEGQIVKEIFG